MVDKPELLAWWNNLTSNGADSAESLCNKRSVDDELGHPAERSERGFQLKKRPNNSGRLQKKP